MRKKEKVAVYFANQSFFKKDRRLNYKSVKNTMSEQCVVFLKQIYNLEKILGISIAKEC